MKEGSIVVMVEKLGNLERLSLLKAGITKWPEPGDTPLEITELVRCKELVSGVGIAVDLYPELAARNMYMDITMFREVMPPDEINIAEVVEMQQLIPA